jgi:hypothetical protein
MPSLSADLTPPRRPKNRLRALRWAAVLILIVALLVAAGILICAIGADGQLSLLQRRPVSECPSVGALPPRALSSIEQREMDHELVRHLLGHGEIKNRYIFILRSNLYNLALPLVRNPTERRDLFARLPCYARPRLFDWRRGDANG